MNKAERLDALLEEIRGLLASMTKDQACSASQLISKTAAFAYFEKAATEESPVVAEVKARQEKERQKKRERRRTT